MKTRYCLLILSGLGAWLPALSAQTPAAAVADASICDILAAPKSFDGKMVRIKGEAIAGYDEFSIRDLSCNRPPVSAIWLAYPEGTKGKAGPVAILELQPAKGSAIEAGAVKPAITLDKNADFQQFDTLLSTPYKGKAGCLGCVRSTVTATFTGRIDAVAEPAIDRDAKGMFTSVAGYGNLNRYTARLVLQSVTGSVTKDIDYSKAMKLPRNDSDEIKGDPVAGSHQAAKSFGAGNHAGDQVERAAAAFGAPGSDNGVIVGFGPLGELQPGDQVKGATTSPDGLLFQARFDPSRLKGKALSEAITHQGELIADIRAGQFKDSFYELEGRAWQTAILSAVAFKEKSLTLPDGGIAWNADWSNEQRGKLISDAIDHYLTGWAALQR